MGFNADYDQNHNPSVVIDNSTTNSTTNSTKNVEMNSGATKLSEGATKISGFPW